MNDLEMTKAFAELEGVECILHKGFLIKGSEFNDVVNSTCIGRLSDSQCVSLMARAQYNPITDLALNCAARDKYHVEIDYDDKSAHAYLDDYVNHNYGEYIADFDCEIEVPRAVIECILKSKGLYK